jgi:hypothetical protein
MRRLRRTARLHRGPFHRKKVVPLLAFRFKRFNCSRIYSVTTTLSKSSCLSESKAEIHKSKHDRLYVRLFLCQTKTTVSGSSKIAQGNLFSSYRRFSSAARSRADSTNILIKREYNSRFRAFNSLTRKTTRKVIFISTLAGANSLMQISRPSTTR